MRRIIKKGLLSSSLHFFQNPPFWKANGHWQVPLPWTVGSIRILFVSSHSSLFGPQTSEILKVHKLTHISESSLHLISVSGLDMSRTLWPDLSAISNAFGPQDRRLERQLLLQKECDSWDWPTCWDPCLGLWFPNCAISHPGKQQRIHRGSIGHFIFPGETQ